MQLIDYSFHSKQTRCKIMKIFQAVSSILINTFVLLKLLHLVDRNLSVWGHGPLTKQALCK